jgi:DNA invertase Pin-like site-specific DNA recombinase
MATSRKNIPDEIRKKIIVMAAKGATAAEIMRATGQTAPTISKVCKDVGIPISRKPKPPTEEKRNLVLDLHSKGYTPTEITCETGIPVSTVRKYIREAKIITFPNAEKHPAEEAEQPVQLTLDVTERAKEKQYEALLMIRDAINLLRDAINLLIEASRS